MTCTAIFVRATNEIARFSLATAEARLTIFDIDDDAPLHIEKEDKNSRIDNINHSASRSQK